MDESDNSQQLESVCRSNGEAILNETESTEYAEGEQETLHKQVLENATLHRLCMMVKEYGIDEVIKRLEVIEKQYDIRG